MDRLLEILRQPYGEPGTRLRESEVPNQEMVEYLISAKAFRVIEEPKEEEDPPKAVELSPAVAEPFPDRVELTPQPETPPALVAPSENASVEPVAIEPVPVQPAAESEQSVSAPKTAPTQRLPADEAPVAEAENEPQLEAEQSINDAH